MVVKINIEFEHFRIDTILRWSQTHSLFPRKKPYIDSLSGSHLNPNIKCSAYNQQFFLYIMLRAFSSLIHPVLTASVRSISNLKTASNQSSFCVRAHLQACLGSNGFYHHQKLIMWLVNIHRNRAKSLLVYYENHCVSTNYSILKFLCGTVSLTPCPL